MTAFNEAATNALGALHRWEEFTGGPPVDTFIGRGVERSIDWFLDVSLDHPAWGQHGFDRDDVRNLRAAVHFGGAVWARDGFPSFRITQGLAAALLLTECEETPLADLQFPLRSFRLDLPGPDYPVAVVTPGGERVGVRWLHVHIADGLEDPKDEEQVTHTAFAALGAKHNDDGSVSFDVDLPEGAPLTPMLRGVPKAGIRELLARFVAGADEQAKAFKPSRVLVITGELTNNYLFLERIPLDRLAAPTVGSTLDVIGARRSEESDAELYQALSLLTLRFLFNFVLYLNDLPAAREGGDYGKRVKATPTRIPERPVTVMPRVWLIGQDVKLPREIRDAARAVVVYAADHVGLARQPWTMHTRHLVRGHWKRQFCGPNRADRRRIWVAPYWRGPDVGVITTHTYDVGLTATDNNEE